MKAFTEQERQLIDHRLRDAGRTFFSLHGWKDTGIDDLARAAGIARGTFYLFYASKDEFFLSLLEEAEGQVGDEVLTMLQNAAGPARTVLLEFLDLASILVDRHPLLKFAFSDPGEPAPWIQALGGRAEEVLQRHDDDLAAKVLDALAQRGLVLRVSASTWAGLLRALVVLRLQKTLIGAEVYDEVRRLLVEALSRGLE